MSENTKSKPAAKAQAKPEETAEVQVETEVAIQTQAEEAAKAQVETEATAKAQVESAGKKTVSLRHKTPYRVYRRAGLVLTQTPKEYQVTQAQLAILGTDTWVEVSEG
jgi:hypothetical protein